MAIPVSTLLLVLGPALGSAPGVQDDPPAPRELLAAATWTELLERDTRLSFSPASARHAREALAAGIEVPVLRGFALLALGSGGSAADRALLEVAARQGDGVERSAAVFALGELEPPAVAALRALAAEGDAGLAASCAVALARAGTVGARTTLEGWATAGERLAEPARVALAFADDPIGGAFGRAPAVEFYLNLRWGAARLYGFVDGMKWKLRLADELAHDDAFLSRVVLSAAVELRSGPLKDHMLETVLAGGRPDRLRGAVAAMPLELARLIESGLWGPPADAEWIAIVDEIERRGQGAEHLPLLVLATENEAVRTRAALLLLAAGVVEVWELVGGETLAPEPERRIAVAEALGGMLDPERVADLTRLRRDRDARVRAAALIALVRLGDKPAIETLRAILDGEPGTSRANVIESLCRASRDRRLHRYLDDLLLVDNLSEDQRLLVEVSLTLHGRVSTRASLRARLERGGSAVALRELLVSALARNADQRDLGLIRGLFPEEGAFDLNVQLAVALIENRDPAAAGLLRVALWRAPWNRAVLAGGLLVHVSGIQALHDELGSPPPRATAEDFRRVGFALGEWGGLAEVEVLARRRRSGDPALQGAYLGALSTRTH